MRVRLGGVGARRGGLCVGSCGRGTEEPTAEYPEATRRTPFCRLPLLPLPGRALPPVRFARVPARSTRWGGAPTAAGTGGPPRQDRPGRLPPARPATTRWLGRGGRGQPAAARPRADLPPHHHHETSLVLTVVDPSREASTRVQRRRERRRRGGEKAPSTPPAPCPNCGRPVHPLLQRQCWETGYARGRIQNEKGEDPPSTPCLMEKGGGVPSPERVSCG